MIALIMAGGRGTRMNIQKEKLLLEYNKPTILHVCDALNESGCFSTILAATSHNSPNTNDFLLSHGIKIIQTSGNGYVDDLNFVLSKLDDVVFVVSGDLPLLDGIVIRELVSKHQKNSTWQSFVVTKNFLDSQNMALEYSVLVQNTQCCYTGISIINPHKITGKITETHTIFNDRKIAINLNTPDDYNLLKSS